MLQRMTRRLFQPWRFWGIKPFSQLFSHRYIADEFISLLVVFLLNRQGFIEYKSTGARGSAHIALLPAIGLQFILKRLHSLHVANCNLVYEKKTMKFGKEDIANL